MKTASTQPLQFSGYPLQNADVVKIEKQAMRLFKNEKNADYFFDVKTCKVVDAPENWDESWFSSYE